MTVIGPENLFASETAAFRYIYTRLDYDLCRSCDLRVFVECVRKGRQEPNMQEENTA